MKWIPCRWCRRRGQMETLSADRRALRREHACARVRTYAAAGLEACAILPQERRDYRWLRRRTWINFSRFRARGRARNPTAWTASRILLCSELDVIKAGLVVAVREALDADGVARLEGQGLCSVAGACVAVHHCGWQVIIGCP